MTKVDRTFLFSSLICRAVLLQFFVIELQRLRCKIKILVYNPFHKLFNYLLDLCDLVKEDKLRQETISLKLFFKTFTQTIFVFFVDPITKSYSRSKEMFHLEQRSNGAKERWTKGAMASWLGCWIPNPGVLSSKPTGSSKVSSTFYPSKVD